MSGRTPSFIVVGLMIIMLLIGLFYMSCSSKNTELRISVEQFEDRIRSLSIKNSDSAKKLESVDSRKRELEEEKLTIQRQMEKKDSEINDLNTKLNERNAELQSLKSDKTALDEQLKDFKSMSATLTEKDSLIAKLRQQLDDQKQSGANELTRVRQEYEAAKGNQSPPSNQQPAARESQSNFQIAPDRFRPLISNNETTRGLSGFLQNSFNRLNNLTKEVKAQIIPAANEVRDRAMDVVGASTNTSADALPNEQRQSIYANKRNEEVGQNLPPPQLDNNALPRRSQFESAHDRNSNDQMPSDNGRFEQRIQRSVNNSAADNVENDDEAQLQMNNVHEGEGAAADPHRQNDVEGHDELARHPSAQRFDNLNYRVADREHDRNQARIDNGDEVENDDENEELDQRVRKRSVL